MIQTASEIRSAARAALRGHWGEAAMLSFVYSLICGLFSATTSAAFDLITPGLGTLTSILLYPMGWSFAIMFLMNSRGEEDPFAIGHLFDGYKDFKRIFPTLFVKELYVILWALLGAIVYFVILWFVLRYDMVCISLPNPSCVWEGDGGYSTDADLIEWVIILIPALIPAFIKSLSYSMTPFILYDKKEMGTKAIDLSMKMMKGHKMELFILYLTFIGWGILCIFTLFIGFFWLNAYMSASLAQFYEQVKEEYAQKQL